LLIDRGVEGGVEPGPVDHVPWRHRRLDLGGSEARL
jgi:hypothetical protein